MNGFIGGWQRERLCGIFWNMCYRSVQCIEKESLKIMVSCRGVFHASVINLVNSKATGNDRVSQVRSVNVQVTNKALLGSFQKLHSPYFVLQNRAEGSLLQKYFRCFEEVVTKLNLFCPELGSLESVSSLLHCSAASWATESGNSVFLLYER